MSQLATLPLRVVPPAIWRARRPQRMLERQWMVNRSGVWMIVIAGFFEPLFYLMSVRVGFGSLIGDVEIDGRPIPYAEFVAPALMAASAMNGAIYESTMNIFFRLKYVKVYDAALATPMTSGDVALGEILNATSRGALYSTAFLATMWALGMTTSMWVVVALPVAVLVSFAFSAAGMAATTYMRSWTDFDYVPSITMCLFLFSATFYPLSEYGSWSWIVQLSPLYHGVASIRALNLGEPTWALLGHVAVLAALALAGLTVAARRIERLLLT